MEEGSRLSHRLLRPLIRLLKWLLNSLQSRVEDPDGGYTENEVMSLLEAGQEKGTIKEEGKKMINSIFAFDDKLAYEIMTPRTNVFLIDIQDPAEKYIDDLMELRYSRIPVCDGEADNIIGILHIKDYLIKARETGFENVDIRSILRKPHLVPDTKNIDSLFFEMQSNKQHIAILIDEFGGFSGIVTMEDIIEEVMGDIDDEYDEEVRKPEKVNDTTYRVYGDMYLDDLNDQLGISLESETSETLGGFLIDILGEIPYDTQDDAHEKIAERFSAIAGTEEAIKLANASEEERAEADENTLELHNIIMVNQEKYLFCIESIHDQRIEKVLLHIKTEQELEAEAAAGENEASEPDDEISATENNACDNAE
ncbi:MAG: hemolysin family protein [Clostridia bacterium]|nr:hemolysin family protein [Clostridia bacterium]